MEIIKVLRNVVEGMDPVLKGIWIGNKFSSTNLKWASELPLFVDGTLVSPKSVDFNNNVIEFNNLTNGIVSLQKPKFRHGTLSETNEELILVKDYKDKLPLIYLKELVGITKSFSSGFEKYQEIDHAMLLFLNLTDYDRFDTEGVHTKVINPMDNLLSEFVNKYNEYVGTVHIKQGVITPLTSVSIKVRGTDKLTPVFDDELAGVSFVTSLAIRLEKDCY